MGKGEGHTFSVFILLNQVLKEIVINPNCTSKSECLLFAIIKL